MWNPLKKKKQNQSPGTVPQQPGYTPTDLGGQPMQFDDIEPSAAGFSQPDAGFAAPAGGSAPPPVDFGGPVMQFDDVAPVEIPPLPAVSPAPQEMPPMPEYGGQTLEPVPEPFGTAPEYAPAAYEQPAPAPFPPSGSTEPLWEPAVPVAESTPFQIQPVPEPAEQPAPQSAQETILNSAFAQPAAPVQTQYTPPAVEAEEAEEDSWGLVLDAEPAAPAVSAAPVQPAEEPVSFAAQPPFQPVPEPTPQPAPKPVPEPVFAQPAAPVQTQYTPPAVEAEEAEEDSWGLVLDAEPAAPAVSAAPVQPAEEPVSFAAQPPVKESAPFQAPPPFQPVPEPTPQPAPRPVPEHAFAQPAAPVQTQYTPPAVEAEEAEEDSWGLVLDAEPAAPAVSVAPVQPAEEPVPFAAQPPFQPVPEPTPQPAPRPVPEPVFAQPAAPVQTQYTPPAVEAEEAEEDSWGLVLDAEPAAPAVSAAPVQPAEEPVPFAAQPPVKESVPFQAQPPFQPVPEPAPQPVPEPVFAQPAAPVQTQYTPPAVEAEEAEEDSWGLVLDVEPAAPADSAAPVQPAEEPVSFAAQPPVKESAPFQAQLPFQPVPTPAPQPVSQPEPQPAGNLSPLESLLQNEQAAQPDSWAARTEPQQPAAQPFAGNDDPMSRFLNQFSQPAAPQNTPAPQPRPAERPAVSVPQAAARNDTLGDFLAQFSAAAQSPAPAQERDLWNPAPNRMPDPTPVPHGAERLCPVCHTACLPGAKFCANCGNPLPKVCAGCGEPLPAGVRYCPYCGRPQ